MSKVRPLIFSEVVTKTSRIPFFWIFMTIDPKGFFVDFVGFGLVFLVRVSSVRS